MGLLRRMALAALAEIGKGNRPVKPVVPEHDVTTADGRAALFQAELHRALDRVERDARKAVN